jgi:hypothetical protein
MSLRAFLCIPFCCAAEATLLATHGVHCTTLQVGSEDEAMRGKRADGVEETEADQNSETEECEAVFDAIARMHRLQHFTLHLDAAIQAFLSISHSPHVYTDASTTLTRFVGKQSRTRCASFLLSLHAHKIALHHAAIRHNT